MAKLSDFFERPIAQDAITYNEMETYVNTRGFKTASAEPAPPGAYDRTTAEGQGFTIVDSSGTGDYTTFVEAWDAGSRKIFLTAGHNETLPRDYEWRATDEGKSVTPTVNFVLNQIEVPADPNGWNTFQWGIDRGSWRVGNRVALVYGVYRPGVVDGTSTIYPPIMYSENTKFYTISEVSATHIRFAEPMIDDGGYVASDPHGGLRNNNQFRITCLGIAPIVEGTGQSDAANLQEPVRIRGEDSTDGKAILNVGQTTLYSHEELFWYNHHTGMINPYAYDSTDANVRNSWTANYPPAAARYDYISLNIQTEREYWTWADTAPNYPKFNDSTNWEMDSTWFRGNAALRGLTFNTEYNQGWFELYTGTSVLSAPAGHSYTDVYFPATMDADTIYLSESWRYQNGNVGDRFYRARHAFYFQWENFRLEATHNSWSTKPSDRHYFPDGTSYYTQQAIRQGFIASDDCIVAPGNYYTDMEFFTTQWAEWNNTVGADDYNQYGNIFEDNEGGEQLFTRCTFNGNRYDQWGIQAMVFSIFRDCTWYSSAGGPNARNSLFIRCKVKAASDTRVNFPTDGTAVIDWDNTPPWKYIHNVPGLTYIGPKWNYALSSNKDNSIYIDCEFDGCGNGGSNSIAINGDINVQLTEDINFDTLRKHFFGFHSTGQEL